MSTGSPLNFQYSRRLLWFLYFFISFKCLFPFQKKRGNCKTVSAKSFSLLPCKKISFPFEDVDKHADQIEMQETRSCAVAK